MHTDEHSAGPANLQEMLRVLQVLIVMDSEGGEPLAPLTLPGGG